MKRLSRRKNITEVRKWNIHQFLEKFNQEYDFLYDNRDQVAGYREAVAWFDEFCKKHKVIVSEFCKFRGDYITSDREAAAFAFAWESLVG